MEKTIGGRTIADFKSGCRRIKSMGTPTARANFPSTPSDCFTVPISLRTNRLAVMSSTAMIAVSEGSNWKAPSRIQRCDP